MARSVPARKRLFTQKMMRGMKRMMPKAESRNPPMSCGATE